uniref:Reverse transcriptase zinc-binding domain-containing protein n=1 Tax=Fagus sylvatica TaxID=28930 RepID=A0A2N9HL29_FAGSY
MAFAVTLWWSPMVWDGFCSDLMVVSDGLGWLLRHGMIWSEFQAFPMDGDKSLKGHLACLSKVQAWSVVCILVAEKGKVFWRWYNTCVAGELPCPMNITFPKQDRWFMAATSQPFG